MSDIRRISTKKPEPIKDEIKTVEAPPIVPTIKTINYTPEYCVGRLFSLYNTAHFYHYQTDNHATHKALEHLYQKLVCYNDEISEFLLGMQVPRRFEYVVIDEIKPYNETALLDFLEAGCDYAKGLCAYADAKGWEALEDMAGELCKVFIHTKLLISYK